MDTSLARHDAVALAALVSSGELSPLELLDDTIDRIEKLDPQINAVIHPLFDKAREAAAGPLPDGPFRGVPMLLKDLWPTSEGDPFHLGMRGLKEADHRAGADSNLTTAYRRAGFVICGRTNTPELGLVATTEPLAHGATRNPWDTSRGPGGSSGGAAAAVSAGMVPAANASDGGGSIRIPASMCGLVGLKPSRGRVSMGPLQDEWGNSVQHVVCHTTRDCAAILDATAHPFPGDGVVAPTTGQPYAALVGPAPAPLRLCFIAGAARDDLEVEPEIAETVSRTAALLETLGHHVEESHPGALEDPALVDDFTALWTAGAAASLDNLAPLIGRPLTSADVEPATWAMAEAGRQHSGPAILTMQAAMMRFRRRMATWWAGGFDLLLTPTCLRTAPPLGELACSPDDPLACLTRSIPYAVFTSPFNITGQPAVSLPVGRTTAGLPIGVQLVAGYAREDLLLSVASQLEEDLDWGGTRSPLHP
ncbi:MAG: amidase [Acidimicrobiales bacterium]